MDGRTGSKWAGSVCIAAGVLLLAASLALIVYNKWDSDRAGSAADSVVRIMEMEMSARTDITDEKAPAGTEILEDAEIPEDAEMSALEIAGNSYIGILDIPKLDIELPVMEDWDMDRMKIAPCRYYGSLDTKDLVIAGHNYASHFSPIKRIGNGTDVYFTNTEGETFHYQVSSTEVLGPEQVEEMVSGDWDLTLFTCTTGGQRRYTVRCVLAE